MGKKNLSRSILEGGRSEYDKDERRQSHVKSRQETRLALKAAKDDSGACDNEAGLKRLPKIGRPDHAPDKDNAVERFLDSQVGKPWSKTFALLKEKFDDRSTTGRHILHDHILGAIVFDGDDRDRYARWRVDAAGILHKVDRNAKKKGGPLPYFIQGYDYRDVVDFLNGRWVVDLDGILVWTALKAVYRCRIEFGSQGEALMNFTVRGSAGAGVPGVEKRVNMYRYRYSGSAYFVEDPVLTPKFHEGRKLTADEARYFFKLPKKVQRAILDASQWLGQSFRDQRKSA